MPAALVMPPGEPPRMPPSSRQPTPSVPFDPVKREAPLIPSTRLCRQDFEHLDEPFGPARFKIAEANGTVSRFGPIGQVIEAEVNERLSDPTAERLRVSLASVRVTGERLSFFGIEARQELVDRTRSARQRLGCDLGSLSTPTPSAPNPRRRDRTQPPSETFLVAVTGRIQG